MAASFSRAFRRGPLLIALAMALLALLAPTAWPAARNYSTVVIDAGHGGFDRGGIPGQRVPEKTMALDVAQRLEKKLRAAGFRVELPPVEQKFGKALGQADKLGARYALILGDDEIATGQWTVKTLADGSQAKMSEAQFLEMVARSKTLSS